jgi:5,10-methylenetetrahydromethanopterin reductase
MSKVQRIGLFVVGNYSCQEVLRYAKVAEENGYDSIWLAEDLGFRDATVPLASLSVSTHRIKLATGILAVYYRSPALTAMTAATLDELSGGRLVLGLGSGAPRFLAAQGIDSSKPLDALREYIEIIRQILKGDSVTYEGRFHNLTDVKLSFKPPRLRIPIYVAARRKKMLQLAGEIADGVFVDDGFCSESYIRWARENVRQGLEKAGRNPRDVDFSCAVFLSVSPDHDQAKENVKPSVLTVLSGGYLDPFLEMWGLTVADITPARDAWLRGSISEACKKAPDALIDGSAIYGTPDECRKKMAEFRAAGVEMPVIRPIGPNTETTIELAANW